MSIICFASDDAIIIKCKPINRHPLSHAFSYICFFFFRYTIDAYSHIACFPGTCLVMSRVHVQRQVGGVDPSAHPLENRSTVRVACGLGFVLFMDFKVGALSSSIIIECHLPTFQSGKRLAKCKSTLSLIASICLFLPVGLLVSVGAVGSVFGGGY